MKMHLPALKLGLAVTSSSFLATAMIGLSAASANAAEFITIKTTGSLSGTIGLPSFNPNFNQSTTRIGTDENGVFFRNIGTPNNPNLVPVYDSDFVKSNVDANGNVNYFVDFKGIPIVSFDGTLTSPILSDGQLTSFKYQGRLDVLFQGVVQDEFNLTKAIYSGTVTDPETGKKYTGDFEVYGFGPRYSDRNGGTTPTVFDFQSDIPGSPTITSLNINNANISNLFVKVPIPPDPESVPEPATITGLLGLGMLTVFLKRKSSVKS
ncbi:MAG TPA: PEP-CTERM sorting domain-containing protein [Nostocaceae cyanobacterium]|nr:PEP-CTERM sorting domain-containing protein [Nostocaceae cyanobacterium]